MYLAVKKNRIKTAYVPAKTNQGLALSLLAATHAKRAGKRGMIRKLRSVITISNPVTIKNRCRNCKRPVLRIT
jgi:hypothetical protein